MVRGPWGQARPSQVNRLVVVGLVGDLWAQSVIAMDLKCCIGRAFNDGVVHWCIGADMSFNDCIGALVQRCHSVIALVHWFIGADISFNDCIGALVHWFIGALVQKCIIQLCTGALTHWYNDMT